MLKNKNNFEGPKRFFLHQAENFSDHPSSYICLHLYLSINLNFCWVFHIYQWLLGHGDTSTVVHSTVRWQKQKRRLLRKKGQN